MELSSLKFRNFRREFSELENIVQEMELSSFKLKKPSHISGWNWQILKNKTFIYFRKLNFPALKLIFFS